MRRVSVVLLVTSLWIPVARAQTPPTPAECQARCAEAFTSCRSRCTPSSGAACQQMCNDILTSCKQMCEALGALQGAQTPAPSKPRSGGVEQMAAVGTQSLTLKVDWVTEAAESTTGEHGTHSYRFYRSKTSSRSELHATIALRVPDIDYSDGLFSFSYLAGNTFGPEYLEVPRAPRKRLPATELVSFTGTASYSLKESEEKGLIMGPDCSGSTTLEGSSPLKAGTPGSSVYGSFRVAFSGDRAMVEVMGQPFPAAGTSMSTCPGGETQKIQKDVGVGATVTDPALFVGTGFADPTCQVQVEKTASGYTGNVRCTKPTAAGGQETRTLNYRIEFAK